MAHGNTEHQEPLLQDQQQHTAAPEQNGTATDPECQVIEGELTTLGHQKATASLGSVISALMSAVVGRALGSAAGEGHSTLLGLARDRRRHRRRRGTLALRATPFSQRSTSATTTAPDRSTLPAAPPHAHRSEWASPHRSPLTSKHHHQAPATAAATLLPEHPA